MGAAATLTVETHGGTLWLCAVTGGDATLLARFTTNDAAERFKALLGHALAAAHAAGASGI